MDIRPSRVVSDHTNGGTLGHAGLSTCVCKCCERLLAIGKGHVEELLGALKKELHAGMTGDIHHSFPI